MDFDRRNFLKYAGIAGIAGGLTLANARNAFASTVLTNDYVQADDIKAPTGRSATLVVAASNSSAKEKAQADYVCDGVADHVEIQEAIDTFGSSGGRVILLNGVFRPSDEVTMRHLTTLQGQGFSTIIRLATGAYVNAISATSINSVNLRNFCIDGSKKNNPYQGNENLQNGILFNDCLISSISDVYTMNCAGNGIRIKTITGTAASKLLYCRLSNILSMYNIGNGISFGVYAEYGAVDNCHFSNNSKNGIEISSANINFTNCQCVQNTLSGVLTVPSAKSYDNTFTGCIINHNLGSGIKLDTSSTTTITGCKIIANENHGIWFKQSTKNTVVGCLISTNGYGHNNTYDNIYLSDVANQNIISDNQILTTAGVTRYGINEASGDYNIFNVNNLDTHATDKIVKTGANSTVHKNVGYATEKTGTATITAAATTVEVTHGLAAAPTRVLLSPTTATAGKQYYVSAKGATTFAITIESPAEAAISFDWQAVV